MYTRGYNAGWWRGFGWGFGAGNVTGATGMAFATGGTSAAATTAAKATAQAAGDVAKDEARRVFTNRRGYVTPHAVYNEAARQWTDVSTGSFLKEMLS